MCRGLTWGMGVGRFHDTSVLRCLQMDRQSHSQTPGDVRGPHKANVLQNGVMAGRGVGRTHTLARTLPGRLVPRVQLVPCPPCLPTLRRPGAKSRDRAEPGQERVRVSLAAPSHAASFLSPGHNRRETHTLHLSAAAGASLRFRADGSQTAASRLDGNYARVKSFPSKPFNN